jgi:hypothetical protein
MLYVYFFFMFSYFTSNTSFRTSQIIWERYYVEDIVLYCNTTPEEDKYFLRYIANGFIPISLKLDDFLGFPDFESFFIYNRMFVKDDKFPNKRIFTNRNTGETGDLSGVTWTEINKITANDLKSVNKRKDT